MSLPLGFPVVLHTKQHYVELARVISLIANDQTRREIAYHFAAELTAKNQNFNEYKFLLACNRGKAWNIAS